MLTLARGSGLSRLSPDRLEGRLRAAAQLAGREADAQDAEERALVPAGELLDAIGSGLGVRVRGWRVKPAGHYPQAVPSSRPPRAVHSRVEAEGSVVSLTRTPAHKRLVCAHGQLRTRGTPGAFEKR